MAKEVKYKRTLEAIASDILEYWTRVPMGWHDEVALPVDAHNEVTLLVETGMFQVGL